jgi:hypothetical protein
MLDTGYWMAEGKGKGISHRHAPQYHASQLRGGQTKTDGHKQITPCVVQKRPASRPFAALTRDRRVRREEHRFFGRLLNMVWEKTTMAKMTKLIFVMQDFTHLQSQLRGIAPLRGPC